MNKTICTVKNRGETSYESAHWSSLTKVKVTIEMKSLKHGDHKGVQLDRKKITRLKTQNSSFFFETLKSLEISLKLPRLLFPLQKGGGELVYIERKLGLGRTKNAKDS